VEKKEGASPDNLEGMPRTPDSIVFTLHRHTCMVWVPNWKSHRQ
jgi:hypothetical protein